MGNAGDEGAGPDPCPMPSESHHAFLCRNDAGTQKAPGEPWAALRGQVLCTGVPHTDAQALFNFNEVGIDRQSLLLLRCRQHDVQDAILKLCVDVLLLHGVTHIEAAGAGTGESLAAQIAGESGRDCGHGWQQMYHAA